MTPMSPVQPPDVSSFAQAWFLVLVGALALLFIWAVGYAAKRPRESPSDSIRWTVIATLVVALWLGVSAVTAASGALQRFTDRPPPLLLLVGTTTLATTLLAFSTLGSRLVERIALGGLIGFQVFRVPLELLLHRLHQEAVIPIQMTYAGSNFDIVSGVLAAVVGAWALLGRPPRWALLGFNLVGLALLVNIVTIALLSSPVPFRAFLNEPANTFVAFTPYVWLPAVLVQAAWFGHLLVFRALRR